MTVFPIPDPAFHCIGRTNLPAKMCLMPSHKLMHFPVHHAAKKTHQAKSRLTAPCLDTFRKAGTGNIIFAHSLQTSRSFVTLTHISLMQAKKGVSAKNIYREISC